MIEQSVNGNVLTLRIVNESQANALIADDLHTLREQLVRASATQELRGVLLTSRGKGFSAGMHTAQFDHNDPDRALLTIQLLGSVCDAVKSCDLPIAVAINGYCIGGALEIAAAADFRIGTVDSWYSMPEVQVGIPSVLESVNLPRLIGWTRAVELMLTGDRFTAEEMLRFGFLNQVAAVSDVEQAALAYLDRCAVSHRQVIAQQKRLFSTWKHLDESSAIADSEKEFALAFARKQPHDA